MKSIMMALFLSLLSWPVAAESARDHLAAFLAQDFAGRGYDRVGPLLEPPKGNGPCGCASFGSHFELREDAVTVIARWRIGKAWALSANSLRYEVGFLVLADSRMTRAGERRLVALPKPMWRRGWFRMERQVDGQWAILADRRPQVGPVALVQALSEAEAREQQPERLASYRRQLRVARLILQRTHKFLAD